MNKVAVITGGSRGIGRASVEKFAQKIAVRSVNLHGIGLGFLAAGRRFSETGDD